MTEIRRLRAEELQAYFKLKLVVYNRRWDFSKPETPIPLRHLPERYWGVFEKGRLVCAMTELEFLMRFDNSSVPMSGIGGVGTLPEARKGGLVRSLFEKFIGEAYDKGVVFSSLYPFSHDFYRKFGYETACAYNEITIPAAELSREKLRGEFTQIFPGDNCSALNEIHNAYIADLNHGLSRDTWPDNLGWKLFTQDDPYNTGTFVYLWRNEAGIPAGYIRYEDEEKNGEHIMYVLDLIFLNRDALYGVLSLVSGLSAQFKKFCWFMPAFLDPADFIPNAWEVEQKIKPKVMTRVINVKAALEKMRRPNGEGAYVLEIKDEFIPANTGKYLVEYGPDGTRVSSVQKQADISCDIPALSQLILGYRTLGSSLTTKKSGIEVHGNREILDRVFTQRPQDLTEFF
jgi:predicted acetyltransferase